MTQKHSKLPFKNSEIDGYILDNENKLVCNPYPPNNENRKFIVTACNHHYELIEALKLLIHWIDLDCTENNEPSCLKEAKQLLNEVTPLYRNSPVKDGVQSLDSPLGKNVELINEASKDVGLIGNETLENKKVEG